jgi:hypothetical protein
MVASNPDPSVARCTTVASRPTLHGGRRKKKRNKKCFVANHTPISSSTFTPTNSLPKRHRFKQQDVRGPSARQAHQGAKHSNLCAAKANRGKSKSHQQRDEGPYLVRSGPTPKRSLVLIPKRTSAKSTIQPQPTPSAMTIQALCRGQSQHLHHEGRRLERSPGQSPWQTRPSLSTSEPRIT